MNTENEYVEDGAEYDERHLDVILKGKRDSRINPQDKLRSKIRASVKMRWKRKNGGRIPNLREFKQIWAQEKELIAKLGLKKGRRESP